MFLVIPSNNCCHVTAGARRRLWKSELGIVYQVSVSSPVYVHRLTDGVASTRSSLPFIASFTRSSHGLDTRGPALVKILICWAGGARKELFNLKRCSRMQCWATDKRAALSSDVLHYFLQKFHQRAKLSHRM